MGVKLQAYFSSLLQHCSQLLIDVSLILTMYQENIYCNFNGNPFKTSVHLSLVDFRGWWHTNRVSRESVTPPRSVKRWELWTLFIHLELPVHTAGIKECEALYIWQANCHLLYSNHWIMGRLRTVFRSLGSIQIRTLSLDGRMFMSLSLAFFLSTTSIDDIQGVCYSFTVIASSFISLSFTRAGSRKAIGIFLGWWTNGGIEGSICKCTLVGSLPCMSLK